LPAKTRNAATHREARMQREESMETLRQIALRAHVQLALGDREAVNLLCSRARDGDVPVALWTTGCVLSLRKLAQLWAVMNALLLSLSLNKKVTQRELWYKLKPCGLFRKPVEVYERVLDVCGVLAAETGVNCPREAVGIIAAGRGTITGAVSLVIAGVVLPLDDTVHALSGDPEECSAYQFIESRARCVLVVEKDTVFNRLVDDGFLHQVPCLLVTARGFPDLATRAFVQHASETLDLPCLMFTDFNPFGMSLMLTYKHGSARFAMERYFCPQLVWIGLSSEDVAVLQRQHMMVNGNALIDGGRADQSQPRVDPLIDEYQPFTARDRATADGLMHRTSDTQLLQEVTEMLRGARKLEIEAIHSLGPSALVDFLVHKIVVLGALHPATSWQSRMRSS